MTFPDLIKEFFESTKERLKTPISGAFMYSFVIYNWRPILLLVFSDASIEDKIIIINHEYCNFWAIFIPIVIATFYTLLIPKIMLQIDNDLAETKKRRINNIYDVNRHRNKEKIKLATEEVELNDIVSGNKSTQELLAKITTLEEANNQRSIADKNIIDDLNLKLQQLNEQATKRDDNGNRFEESGMIQIYNKFTPAERNDLRTYKKSKIPWKFENFTIDLRKKLIDQKLVSKDSKTSDWMLTALGANILNLIELI